MFPLRFDTSPRTCSSFLRMTKSRSTTITTRWERVPRQNSWDRFEKVKGGGCDCNALQRGRWWWWRRWWWRWSWWWLLWAIWKGKEDPNASFPPHKEGKVGQGLKSRHFPYEDDDVNDVDNDDDYSVTMIIMLVMLKISGPGAERLFEEELWVARVGHRHPAVLHRDQEVRTNNKIFGKITKYLDKQRDIWTNQKLLCSFQPPLIFHLCNP